MAHSQLGSIDVYNLLPQYVVAAGDVKTFQNRLQQMLKAGAAYEVPGWETLLSNRLAIFQHPIKNFSEFEGFGGAANGYTEDARLEKTSNACIQGWLQFGQ